MQFLQTLNGTRLGTLLQTILYISGVPLFQDNITSDGFTRSSSIVFRNLEVEGPHPEGELHFTPREWDGASSSYINNKYVTVSYRPFEYKMLRSLGLYHGQVSRSEGLPPLS